MAWKYNPFTDALDKVGSGGASYIDGVVADPTALPVTLGTPALDSVYLAKAGSGVWLINRRPSGLYVRVANNGNLNDWLALGAFPEVNSSTNWELYDGTDPTKELKFDLSGITTGTTRTLTVPNASGRIQVEGQPIGNTTPAAGTFTTLAANNGTLTASAPVLDLAQTWNNVAVTFTGLRLNVTNTASAAASDLIDVQIGGTTVMRLRRSGSSATLHLGQFTNSGFYTAGPAWHGSNAGLVAGTNLAVGALLDTILERDAADTLAQRRTTNPQVFRIYNTSTDASNHERGFIGWSSNTLRIGTEKAGTGSARALELQTDGTTRYTLAATTGQLSSQNSRIVLDDANTVIHSGNTPRISLYGASTVLQLALGNAVDIRWSNTGRSDQATSYNISLARDADGILAQRAGTTAQTWRLYNTVSGTNNVNFDRVNFRWASNEFIIDAEAGGTGTLRGIKIGSATSSLLGFYGATPVDRPATVADPTGGGTVDAEARTAINDIIDRLQELGLIA